MSNDAEPAGGGWEGAVDPRLVRRLTRPLTRPGLLDPGHGRAIAGRLQRASAVPLSQAVRRRYAAVELGGERPPIVHAVHRPREMVYAPGDSVAADPPGPARPVVRAAERVVSPSPPPVRPLGIGAVIQRSPDPAAPLPVVSPRRGGFAAATDDARPPAVVAPHPSPLRRALEDGRSESSPPPPGRPRVIASRPARADGGGVVRRSVAPGTAFVADVDTGGAPSTSASPSLPVTPAGNAWREAGVTGQGGGGSGMAHPATGPVIRGSSSPRPATGTTAVAAPGSIQRSPDPAAPPLPRVAARPVAGGAREAAPGMVQRAMASAPAPAAAPASASTDGRRGAAVDAARPVQRATAEGGAVADARARTLPVVRARPAPAAADGLLQRAPLAGAPPPEAAPARAAPALVHPAPVRTVAASASTPAAATVQRMTNGSPPAGAPSAELPTRTADWVNGNGDGKGADVGRIADQVYEVLVRRLTNERRQRGW